MTKNNLEGDGAISVKYADLAEAARLHPTPCALHSTPYTLSPKPYNLHHTPCTRINLEAAVLIVLAR